MKLMELMEMAKSKNKRKRDAKLARKRKVENPVPDDLRNPVAKNAQTSGAGAHKSNRDNNRQKQKRQWKKDEGL